MNAQEFTSRVATLVGETSDVEFKGPATLDEVKWQVIRATLAMSNRRNGGLVVIGVDEVHHRLEWNGLTPNQAATWIPDHFADLCAVYADPSVECHVESVTFQGKTFVTVEVVEFDTVPVVCKRDGNGLREGAIYVRPRRKPESVEIPTAADARDLLELASEKLTRRLLGTAERVGLVPSTPPLPDDQAKFDSQISGLLQ